jgi:hypothetical protein
MGIWRGFHAVIGELDEKSMGYLGKRKENVEWYLLVERSAFQDQGFSDRTIGYQYCHSWRPSDLSEWNSKTGK